MMTKIKKKNGQKEKNRKEREKREFAPEHYFQHRAASDYSF